MTHLERYAKIKEAPLSEQILELRALIGELPNLEMPTKMQVETTVAAVFPSLLQNEQSKLVEAFLKSEEDAAAEADRLA
jgi:hypothetical protein